MNAKTGATVDAGLTPIVCVGETLEERESDRAGAFTREGVGALTAGELDALRFELPGAAVLRALPPAQRAMVLLYFERLNRTAPPAGEGGR